LVGPSNLEIRGQLGQPHKWTVTELRVIVIDDLEACIHCCFQLVYID
jgi:hypothetical protein